MQALSSQFETLLAGVQAEDISWERQAFGAAIAAELAVRADSHRPVVKKALDVIPPEKLRDAESVRLQFDLVQNREHFASLETHCRQALKEEEDEKLIKWNYGLLDLSYKVENILPALSIAFACAAAMGRPEAYFDNEMLVDVARGCRAELGHDPWKDPLEDFFDWTMKKIDYKFQDEEKDRQILELKEKLIRANRSAAQKQNELRSIKR